MFPWRLIVGAVVGAIVVKEWKRADRLYGSARAKLVAAMKKIKETWRDADNTGGTEPENPTA